MAGRPTSLTPDVAGKICDAMKVGAYQYEAAQYAGVHPNSLTNWLRTGRADIAAGDEGTLYAEFVAEFEQSENRAVMRALASIQTAAAGGDWRAAMTWLSRRHPDRWGEHAQLGVTVNHADERDVELIGMIREAKAKQAVEEARLRGGEAEGQQGETE
jgi:hypothetical protein